MDLPLDEGLDNQREELTAQEPLDAHRVREVARGDCLVGLQLPVAVLAVRLVSMARSLMMSGNVPSMRALSATPSVRTVHDSPKRVAVVLR